MRNCSYFIRLFMATAFLLAVLSTLFIADWWDINSQDDRYRIERAKKHAQEATCWVLGSSHTYCGVVGDSLKLAGYQPAFWCVPGANVRSYQLLLQTALNESSTNPRFCVIELSPQSFLSPYTWAPKTWHRSLSPARSVLTLPSETGFTWADSREMVSLSIARRANKWLKWVTFRDQRSVIPVDTFGNQIKHYEVDSTELRRIIASKFTGYSQYIFDSQQGQILLDSIVPALVNRNIEVVFIETRKAAFDRFFSVAYRQAYEEFMQKIARLYHFLPRNRSTGFDLVDFADANHLNHRGRAKYSHILTEYLRETVPVKTVKNP